MVRHAFHALVAAAVALSACLPTEPDDEARTLNRCEYLPGGLSLSGCVVMTGIVVDSTGAPVPGAMAGPTFAAPDGQSYYAGMYDTDAHGRFRFALRRFSGVPVGALSDSGFHWVRAQVLPPFGHGPITVVDSVLVRYRLRAPSGVADTIFIRITLPARGDAHRGPRVLR